MSNIPRIPTVESLLTSVVDSLQTDTYSDAVLVGIRRGGAWIVDELQKRLGRAELQGILILVFIATISQWLGCNLK